MAPSPGQSPFFITISRTSPTTAIAYRAGQPPPIGWLATALRSWTLRRAADPVPLENWICSERLCPSPALLRDLPMTGRSHPRRRAAISRYARSVPSAGCGPFYSKTSLPACQAIHEDSPQTTPQARGPAAAQRPGPQLGGARCVPAGRPTRCRSALEDWSLPGTLPPASVDLQVESLRKSSPAGILCDLTMTADATPGGRPQRSLSSLAPPLASARISQNRICPRACEIILDKLFVYRVISPFRRARGNLLKEKPCLTALGPAGPRVPAAGSGLPESTALRKTPTKTAGR